MMKSQNANLFPDFHSAHLTNFQNPERLGFEQGSMVNDCITMLPGCAILQLQKQNDPKTNIFGLKSKTWIVGVLRLFVSARNYNSFTFILQVPHICAVVSQLDIISPYSWPTVPQNLKCKMGLSLVGASISLLTVSFQSSQCKI